MTEAMGDRPAAEVASAFCERIESAAPGFEVDPVKRIGDAVMVRCERPEAAIRFGVNAAQAIGESHFFPTVRVGMHTGSAIERDGDWFGSAVNLAARVSAEAGGSEVLLTEATRAAAGEIDGVEMHERGRRSLRNVGEPVSLYAAVPSGERDREGLPIDPVCRMAVDPEHGAGTLVHEGLEHHFCSLECVAKFAADPGRYAVAGPQSSD
jgi:adenylate cyclase